MAASFINTFLTPIPAIGNDGIYRAVAELSVKAGISMPSLHVSNGRHIMLEMMPAATLSVGGRSVIMLNPKMLNEILGDGIDFANHATITDELKSILAHEMGHIKHGDNKIFGMGGAARFTPLACMLGVVTGLHLIRRHQEKNKHHKEQLSPQEAEEALKLPEEVKSPTLHAAQKVALYTVAAAAGLATGIFISRGLRHHMEYAADAFSKELMGSGKPLASAMGKMGVYMEKLNKDVMKGMSEKTQHRMKAFFETIQGLFHPPIAKRIERLRN